MTQNYINPLYQAYAKLKVAAAKAAGKVKGYSPELSMGFYKEDGI